MDEITKKLLDEIKENNMIIKEKGQYEVIKDFKTRGSISTTNILKGEIITITQIDFGGQKVIGLDLFDWVQWDLPVKKL